MNGTPVITMKMLHSCNYVQVTLSLASVVCSMETVSIINNAIYMLLSVLEQKIQYSSLELEETEKQNAQLDQNVAVSHQQYMHNTDNIDRYTKHICCMISILNQIHVKNYVCNLEKEGNT